MSCAAIVSVWENMTRCDTLESFPQARVTDAVQFGDGFGLAGAVIMHLLGQRHQFELLDFSCHVLNVNNFER